MAENIFPDLKNESLVKAMEAIKANENPETQSAFVTAALNAKYFAPVDIMDGEGNLLEGNGKMEVPKDAKFNFKLIVNNNGDQFFPLFTDIEEFKKWNKSEKIKAIVVSFPQMANLVSVKSDSVKGMSINPLNQNLIFTKELLDNILEHLKNQAVKSVSSAEAGAAPEAKKITVMFGKPTNIPDSVMSSITKTVAKHKEVNTAYFLMMKQEEKEHYLFILDIDADAEKSKKIADSICSSVRLFLTKFPVLVAPLKSPIGENAPKVTEPFYTKA